MRFRRLLARWGVATDERVLDLERAVRDAELTVSERDGEVARLRGDLDRARSGAASDARQHAAADRERLVQAISTPVVQLMTQAHLHRTGSAEISAAAVLDVGERLVRGLRREGVETVGEIGAAVPFDPAVHEPLGAGSALTAGAPVVVRTVGVRFLGTVLRKAGVDGAEH